MDMKGNGKLFAEGLEVGADHITEEEFLGEWREVTIIETIEDMGKLSEDKRNALVERTFKEVNKKKEFDEKNRGLN